jgi:hypothetical protein
MIRVRHFQLSGECQLERNESRSVLGVRVQLCQSWCRFAASRKAVFTLCFSRLGRPYTASVRICCYADQVIWGMSAQR